MRLFFSLFFVLSVAASLPAQQLSTFVQTQSDDGILALQNRFGATAGYGSQFAVLYDNTDPTVGKVTPTIYLINQDGSLGTSTTFPEATGSFLANAANSPDGTQAWFFGTVDPAEGSGQNQDLGVIYGDGSDFTYSAFDFGVSEFFRGGTATENHLYALTEVSNGVSNAQQFTLVKLATDLSLVDSLSIPLQGDFALDYILADESEDFVLIVLTSSGNGPKLLGVRLGTGEVFEYTLPTLMDNCIFQMEKLARNGGIAEEESNVFNLFTTCGRVFIASTDGSISPATGNFSEPYPNEFGVRILRLAGQSNYLVLNDINYKKIDLASGDINEFEAGEYGDIFNLDISRLAYNSNERILTRTNFDMGSFNVVTQGVPGDWPFQPAETLPLPVSRFPGSRLYNPARFGDDLFAILQVDSLQPTERIQRLDPLSGDVEAVIPIFANEGISAPQLLDNGNYVVQRIVFNLPTSNQDGSLLEFNNNGEVGELARWETNFPFQSAIWQRLVKAPNGDLITVINNISPTFDPAIEVRRYTQSGTEVYATTLPDNVSDGFVYATPTVDAEGNLYFLVPTASQKGYRIVSLDPLGALRYVTTNRGTQTFNSSFSLFRLKFNASGIPHVMAMLLDNDGRSQALLAQIDPEDGAEVGALLFAPEVNTTTFWGDFIPGTDSLVIHHGYFSADGPDPTKPYNNRVLFFDENLNLIYAQEVLSTTVNDQFLPEGITVSQDHIYVTGSRLVPEFDDDFASVLGVDFSNLAIVLGLDDFAEATKLKVFPNPATGLVNLAWEDNQTGTYQIKVLNIAGQLMQSTSGNLFSGHNQLAVDLSAYPAGTYYLRLLTPSGTTTQSVSKQ